MYRYKQWDWFSNQKPLFVITKSINSYTEGIVNGMHFEMHYQGMLLYYLRNKQLSFLVCYVCLDILPDFSYCTNPISTSFSSLQQPIPKVANVSPLSIIVGGTTLPMHFGRSWKTVHTTYEKTRR